MATDERNQMPRTILVHLNIEVPDRWDMTTVGPDELADEILSVIESGSDEYMPNLARVLGPHRGEGALASGNDAPLCVTLAEEV